MVERPIDRTEAERDGGVRQEGREIRTRRVCFGDEDLLQDEVEVGLAQSGHGVLSVRRAWSKERWCAKERWLCRTAGRCVLRKTSVLPESEASCLGKESNLPAGVVPAGASRDVGSSWHLAGGPRSAWRRPVQLPGSDPMTLWERWSKRGGATSRMVAGGGAWI